MSMKVDGVNSYFHHFNFQKLKISRSVEVLSKEEIEFFEKLFPDDVERIREYYRYDLRYSSIFEAGKIINKKV
ncbi:hypothetical protein [Candidatus Kryptobacter tengchongensis]|uniref:Uncharacterized protein n=1 Tax=Kryptobacter tengchongensis TaxID=1643429 RepID=A0A656D455_KRYT1|nr:hypothetical protein [Candidatus Kryptobacter tengchongensis]CUS97560.1 hypothetical protein JGI24_00298 [Candidatus Kryptobacter tengchongensis]